MPETVELASRAIAGALRERSSRGLAAVEGRLLHLAEAEADSWSRALIALADACRATRELDELRGLGAPSQGLVPESLPARLLAEIDRGARVGNADLAELLETDQWQLSRAGRRLRELGLVTRSRIGRVNCWDLTEAGRREVDRLRATGKIGGRR